jgi:hypothetical protein
VTKKYQTSASMTSAELRHAVPETVSVSMAEIAEDMREGLLALAVGTGLQVMRTPMEEDVTADCGPKGKHDPARTATRQGHEAGSVTWAGAGCRSSGRPTSCSAKRRSWAGWR